MILTEIRIPNHITALTVTPPFSFEKPIARLIGQLRRVILLPNISVRQNSSSSGAAKAK